MTKEETAARGREYYRANAVKIRARVKKYSRANAVKIRARQAKYRQDNAAKIKARRKKHRRADAAKLKVYNKEYYRANADKIKARNKKYRLANPAKIKMRRKKYYRANRAKCRESARRWLQSSSYAAENRRERRRLAAYIHQHVWSAGAEKCDDTLALVGCIVREYRQYIKAHWLPGMTWKNRRNKSGGWVVHHIVPVGTFNLKNKEAQYKAFHYTNVIPMWRDDHVALHAKLDAEEAAKRAKAQAA